MAQKGRGNKDINENEKEKEIERWRDNEPGEKEKKEEPDKNHLRKVMHKKKKTQMAGPKKPLAACFFLAAHQP